MRFLQKISMLLIAASMVSCATAEVNRKFKGQLSDIETDYKNKIKILKTNFETNFYKSTTAQASEQPVLISEFSKCGNDKKCSQTVGESFVSLLKRIYQPDAVDEAAKLCHKKCTTPYEFEFQVRKIHNISTLQIYNQSMTAAESEYNRNLEETNRLYKEELAWAKRQDAAAARAFADSMRETNQALNRNYQRSGYQYNSPPPIVYGTTTSTYSGSYFNNSSGLRGSSINVGDTTYYNFSDGTRGSSTKIGDSYYHSLSDGTRGTSTQIGDSLFHRNSDGTTGTSTKIGDTYFHSFSDGTRGTSIKIGDTYYNSYSH